MARRGVKKKDHEKLDDATISRVIALLESDSPITKKEACQTLNISYNTTRLNRIIEEYKDKLEFEARRRKQMKGKPFDDMETKDIVVSYLSGESVAVIAKRLYRSVGSVKSYITSLNLPERDRVTDYTKPKLMPDEMISEDFEVDEYVWSAKYNCVAQIKEGQWEIKQQIFIYRVYVFGKFMQFAYQPAFELGKLDVLKKFSIREDEFSTEEDFNYRI